MKLSNNFQKIQHTATLINYINKIEKTLRRDFGVLKKKMHPKFYETFYENIHDKK